MALHRIASLVQRVVETATVDVVGEDREVRFDPQVLGQFTKELRTADSVDDASQAAMDEISRILLDADIPRTQTDPEYKDQVLHRALAGVKLRELIERQPQQRRYVNGPDGLRAVDE